MIRVYDEAGNVMPTLAHEYSALYLARRFLSQLLGHRCELWAEEKLTGGGIDGSKTTEAYTLPNIEVQTDCEDRVTRPVLCGGQ